LETWADAIRSRLTEAYVWFLVPRQEPDGPLAIDVLKVNGTGTLAERASKKAVDSDLLVTTYAASNLRMELDRVPLWRDGNHVSVGQLWDDFSRYPYLPRLRSQQILLAAVQDGPMQLNAQQDGFGYADAFDPEGPRYRGLVFHDAADKASLSGVVVEYSVAQRQWEADRAAAGEADHRPELGDDGEDGGATGRTGAGGQTGSSGAKVTHFTALKEIDPVRAGRDAATIADEVIAHFTDSGAKVKVIIEIEAEDAAGFNESLRRIVTENASTLGFSRHEFE